MIDEKRVTQNKMPSQKVSSHTFGLVTAKVLNSYKKGICE